MVCKEEVFSWFQSLTSPKRIEFLCGLLDFCHPIELRFLGTCLEELCRKDYNFLRDSEQKANNTHELQALDDISDDTVRTKLIVYLALLYTTNSQGSNVLSHTLNHVESTVLAGLQLTDQIKEEFLLLLAMAANHPAFSIHQRLTFSNQMERLQAQPTVEVCKGSSPERRKDAEEEVVSEEASTTTSPQQSTESSKETPQQKVYVRSIEVKGCKKTGGRDRGCVYTMQVNWSDGTITTVNRTYRDLCDFQCKLQNLFPDETGANRSKGIIPHLPGKAGETGKRDVDMENYVRQLVSLPRHILESDHVTSFFGHQQYHHPYPANPPPASHTPNSVQDGVDECRRPWCGSEPSPSGGSHQHHCPTSIPSTCHDAAGSTAGSPHTAPDMPSPVNDHKAGPPLQIPMVHGTTMPTHVSYQCPRQARFYKHTYASLRTSSPAPSTSALPVPLPSPHETFLPSPPPTSPRNLGDLLKEIRLHKYYSQLKDYRIDQILGMTEEDLANLGLTEGARRKLKIHLDAVQNPAYRAVLGPKNKTTCTLRKGPMNGLHVDIPIHQATAVVTGPMPVMPPPSPIQTPPPNYPPTVQPGPHQTLLHMQSLPSNSGDSSSSECCSSPTPSSPRHQDKESSESSDEGEKEDEYPTRQVANAWRNPPHNRRAGMHHPSQQRPPPPPPPFCHVETQHRSHWTHRQPQMGRMDKGFPPNRPYAIPIVPNAVQMGHGNDQSPVPPLQNPLDGRIIPTVNATAVIATTQVENRSQGNNLRPNVSSFQPQLMSPQAENFPHTIVQTLTLPSTITTVSVATTGFSMFPTQGKCPVVPPSGNEVVTIGKGTVTFVSTTTSASPGSVDMHYCSTRPTTNVTQTVAQTVVSKGESKDAANKTEDSSEGSAKGTTTVTYANPTLQNAVNMTSESSPSPSTSTTPSNPPPPPPPSSSHNGPHSRGCSNCGCNGNCGSSNNYTFNYPGYLHPNNMNSPFPFHFGHYFPNLGGNGLIGIPPPGNIPSYTSFPHLPPLQFPNGLNPASMYNFQGSYGHMPPNYMHPSLMLPGGGQGMFPMGGMGKGKGSQTCYNCGATGHTARECKDSTMEQMSAQGMFRLKYQPQEPLDTTD